MASIDIYPSTIDNSAFFNRAFSVEKHVDSLFVDFSGSDIKKRDVAIYKLQTQIHESAIFQETLRKGLLATMKTMLELPQEKQTPCLLLNVMKILKQCAVTLDGRREIIKGKVLANILAKIQDSNDELHNLAHDILQEILSRPIEKEGSGNSSLDFILTEHPNIIKTLLSSLKTGNIIRKERALETMSIFLTNPLIIPSVHEELVSLSSISSLERGLVDTTIYNDILPFVYGSNPSNIRYHACNCIAAIFSHPRSTPPYEQFFSILDMYLGGSENLSQRSAQGFFRVILTFCSNTPAKMYFVGKGGVDFIVKMVKLWPNDFQLVSDGLQILCLLAEDPRARIQLLQIDMKKIVAELYGSNSFVSNIITRLNAVINRNE